MMTSPGCGEGVAMATAVPTLGVLDSVASVERFEWRCMARSLLAAALIFLAAWPRIRAGSGPCGCGPGLFLCSENCTCIPDRWRCDSDDDCGDGSDEAGCDTPTCSTDHFACANGRCILKSWWCDGDNDCGENSDEFDCGSRNCSSDEFRCLNGRCIRPEWQCDGDDDCGDQSDESCPARACAAGEFRCHDGSCVTLSWRCDHEVDCRDGSDEQGCQLPSLAELTCSPEHFRCTNTRCVSASYRCDSDNDCGDWSDEEDCVGKVDCRQGEFQCQDGLCINLTWRCDGDFDCDDQSDEHDCPVVECTSDQFRCSGSSGGRCIRHQWRCDGDADCADGSDEVGCEETPCPGDQIRCPDGPCLLKSQFCDGQVDCPDASDENATCSVVDQPGSPCRDDGFPCQHLCLSSSGTPRCACKDGYELAPDRRSCLDVDECLLPGTCSHRCINTVPGFQCTCAKGYRRRSDKRRCKALGPETYLLFANRADIRRVSLSAPRQEYTSVVGHLKNAIALDFHWTRSLLFWSDITTDAIYRSPLNSTSDSDVEPVVSVGLSSPGGLAVDWLADKIFWTDSGMSRIEVATLEGNMRKVLFWKDLDKPRAIVASPEDAVLCWTDWGSRPRVECGFQDGSDRYTVADSDLYWPNGLTLDYASRTLFWVDAKLHVIETAFIDGSYRRRVLHQGLHHPFAITVFEDVLYWTDWHTKSIHSASKFLGANSSVVHSRLQFPMDLAVLHPLRQPEARHPCRGPANGGCSHLCLPNNRTASCLCPNGFKMNEDGKSCLPDKDTFLVFARRSDIRRLCLECFTDELVDDVVPVRNISSAVDLDFDEDALYWTDITRDVISRARWDGGDQRVVIGSGLESPTGLALDWVTRKLYWADTTTKTIEVANLDGSMRSILIWSEMDRPRDIVVHPEQGVMYWTDWGDRPRIERAGMDGSQRSPIVNDNLTWPNGLAIDSGQLYWTDAGTHTIQECLLDGSNRKVLIASGLPHPFGLAVHNERLYWTDWESRTLESADRQDGGNRKTLLTGLDNLMDIQVFHRQRANVSSACHVANGGCSHLCLLSPSARRYTCACPTGVLLTSNERTCADGMKHFLIVTRRTDIRTISLDVPYVADVILPLKHLKDVVAVDVDTISGNVFWSGGSHIRCWNRTRGDISTAVATGLESANGLALDSIGRQLYWTDSSRHRIEVKDLRTGYRKVLIWADLDSPRALALHYEEGYLFWTDWGNQPRIERADMDGLNRKVLVDVNLGWPNGLTVDGARLVWADARTNLVETVNFEGVDRRILVADVPHPYGIAATPAALFWTDWETRAIHKSLRDGSGTQQQIRGDLAGLMDIRAIRMGKLGYDRCGEKHGRCNHLCLRNPRGFECACATGIAFKDDGRTCPDTPAAYLVLAERGNIRRISLDTDDHSDVILPIPEVYNAVAVDFDLALGKLYYTDVRLDLIRRSNVDGTGAETLVASDLVTAGGLALDWVAHNMYWTDAGRNSIEVARVDGTARLTLIDLDLDEPRAIAVFPSLGFVFWSDWGSLPKIERAFLDGSSRRIVVTTDLGWPNGLTLDYESQMLYWADAHYDRIEFSDLEGKNRKQIVHDVPHPFGLTLFEDFVYWTDWQSKSVEKAHKITGLQRSTVQYGLEYLMEIKAVAPSRQTGTNPCENQNGGCSHLCLFRGTGHFVCACPSYPDRRPCSTIPGSIITKASNDTKTNSTTTPSLHRCPLDRSQCHVIGFSVEAFQGAYVALSAVLGSLLLLGAFAAFLWKRRRRRDAVDPTLTFSNPTYSASNGDVTAEKHRVLAFGGWPKAFLRDSDSHRKGGSLAVPMPPPPPPRLDSRCLTPTPPSDEDDMGVVPVPRFYTVETDI